MKFVEVQSEDLTDQSIKEFWGALVLLGAKSVKINLSTEAATISGIIDDWLLKDSEKAGVRLSLYKVMLRWDRLSESGTSDEDYYDTLKNECKNIMGRLSNFSPAEIKDIKYCIDDEDQGGTH